jgi:hypothetical protein
MRNWNQSKIQRHRAAKLYEAAPEKFPLSKRRQRARKALLGAKVRRWP